MDIRFGFAAMISLALAGCGGSQAAPKICSSFLQPSSDQMAVLPWAEKLDVCLHKWSYRLAQSKEPASVVAIAAIGACQDALDARISEKLDKSVLQSMNAYNDGVEFARKKGLTPPATEWQPPTAETIEKQVSNHARTNAIFRVTQARAGNCEVP